MSFENELKLELDPNFDPNFFWTNYIQEFDDFYFKKKGYSFDKSYDYLEDNITKTTMSINFFKPLLDDYPTLNDLLTKVNVNLADYLLETKSKFNCKKSDSDHRLTFNGYINEFKDWVDITGECYFSHEDGKNYFNYSWSTKINLGWVLDTTGYIGDFLKKVIDEKIKEEYNEYPKICMEYYINAKKKK